MMTAHSHSRSGLSRIRRLILALVFVPAVALPLAFGIHMISTRSDSQAVIADKGSDDPDDAVASSDDNGRRSSGDSGQTTPTALSGLDLAFVDDAAWHSDVPPTTKPSNQTTTSFAETTTSTSVATSAQPVSTSGSGAAPATTISSSASGDTSIYQGTLGRLGRNDQVVPPRAPAPSVGPGIMPLTGLPGSVPNRPALVVKIDNGGPARPQTGLNSADIVIEEEVEGGVTRFAAVFHSTSSIVGPVRSARTTDIGIINGFGAPVLLYSGANDVTDTLIRAQPTVQNRSAATSSGYWRNSSRRAPSNLYSDTAPHWATASGGPPPAQFAYRSPDSPVGGVDDTSFTVAYRASHAGWNWVGTHWVRTQGGAAHMTAGAGQVSATNVVVIEAQEVATGMVDSSGATVPEFVFVGEGKATVFTGGKRIEGIWNRPTLASVATLATADGSVIELAPGRTWIELIRAGAGMLR